MLPAGRPNSWSRGLAGGVKGPVAVEPDHAPFDALAEAGKAAVLDDRIVDGVDLAVAQHHVAGAIAARNIVGLPRPEGDLMDVAIGLDFQPRIPVHALLFLELRGDGAERLLADLDPSVIARAEQTESEFEGIGGERRLGERRKRQRGAGKGKAFQRAGEVAHVTSEKGRSGHKTTSGPCREAIWGSSATRQHSWGSRHRAALPFFPPQSRPPKMGAIK